MITLSRIRNYLGAAPFQPFRIFLSDGSYHDVPHPEFAWVVGSRLLVAERKKGEPADEPWIKELSVLHVTRVEPLARKAKK